MKKGLNGKESKYKVKITRTGQIDLQDFITRQFSIYIQKLEMSTLNKE